MIENSKILSVIIGLMYPFVLISAFYIVLNGHMTPGGGFQGGAMMSSVFMSRYLVRPQASIDFDVFQVIEKFAFFFLVLLGLSFFIFSLNYHLPILNIPYMILMNLLIGFKVCCGLSLVFFRFVFFESR